jgi:carbon-monoxide dehydrogenase medium subunit
VIAADVRYRRPHDLADAVAMLAEPGAAALAGGQSLLPAMKLRTVRPELLVDLGRLPGLSGVEFRDGVVAIGPLTTHQDLHHDPVLRDRVPMLAYVAGTIADPQVRHRGTVGGSLAHADPAADLPVALLALGATVELRGPDGAREVPVGGFATGRHRTVLRPGEIVTRIRVSDHTGAAWGYRKFHRAALDWALVSVAAVRSTAGSTVVALGNLAPAPVRAAAVEAALAAGASVEEAAAHAADGCDLPPDPRASDGYRRHLATVLTARVLRETAP